MPIAIVVGMALSPAIISGCALLTKQNAKTALDATAIACVFASEESDAPALASACGIARDLIPLIRQLIGTREAARRSGVVWSSDGGGK